MPNLKRTKRSIKKVEYSIQRDPKKQDFLRRYYEPTSETYANAYKSAIDAGYSENYARQIVSIGSRWIKIGNYVNSTNLTPEHIIKSAEKIALKPDAKDSDKIKSIEFLAKVHGMLIEKKVIAHTNIEDWLNDFEGKLDEPDPGTATKD
jgi:hypothetical protein